MSGRCKTEDNVEDQKKFRIVVTAISNKSTNDGAEFDLVFNLKNFEFCKLKL